MKNKDKILLGKSLYERKFTPRDIMHLMLNSMYHKGIMEVNEDELAKKLYAYHINPRYKDLIGFPHFVKKNTEEKIDLSEALLFEKYFSDNVSWTKMNSKLLRLNYNKVSKNERQETDIEKLRAKLGEENVQLLDEITNQLAINYQVESKSTYKLNIYDFDPNNRSYILVNGQYYVHNYGWQLITDGNIENREDIPFLKQTYFNDPTGLYCAISFKDYVASKIKIIDATYAVMQGKKDDKTELANVFTKLKDLSKLETISSYINQMDHDSSSLLIEETPYVKKLLLK